MKKQLLAAACGLFLSVGAANAQIVVRIGPPPPHPVEVVPEAPPAHRDYVWVPGGYRRPPHPHAVWVPGEWRGERGGHVWHEGYWR